jgi:hypothetical protein
MNKRTITIVYIEILDFYKKNSTFLKKIGGITQIKK